MPFKILYTYIRCALDLLCSNGKPSSLNLSLEFKSLILCTILVALLCTFSIDMQSFLYKTDQTVDAYSKWGRTNRFV